MVRSVVATMSYSRSPCNNATIPRTQDPFAGDADVFPPPQLSADEKAVFSRYMTCSHCNTSESPSLAFLRLMHRQWLTAVFNAQTACKHWWQCLEEEAGDFLASSLFEVSLIPA